MAFRRTYSESTFAQTRSEELYAGDDVLLVGVTVSGRFFLITRVVRSRLQVVMRGLTATQPKQRANTLGDAARMRLIEASIRGEEPPRT